MDPQSVHDYQLLERPDLGRMDSDGSGDSDELLQPAYVVRPGPVIPELPEDYNPHQIPSPNAIASSPPNHSAFSAWTSVTPTRPRGASIGTPALEKMSSPAIETPSVERELRLQRPSVPARTPSSTYAPQRRPPPFISFQDERQRSSSSKRTPRLNPEAQYRAQEKAYVQRIREDPQGWYSRFEDHGLVQIAFSWFQSLVATGNIWLFDVLVKTVDPVDTAVGWA